jgi:hypothetical protein
MFRSHRSANIFGLRNRSSCAASSSAAAATATGLLLSAVRSQYSSRFNKSASDSTSANVRDSSQTTGSERTMPSGFGFSGGGAGSRYPGGGAPPTAAGAKARAMREEAATSMVGAAIPIRKSVVRSMPPWERMAKICRREVIEEQRRPHRPPVPKIPLGWTLEHTPGTSYFTLQKRVSGADPRGGGGGVVLGGGADEEYRIFAAGEIKEPEFTFRGDDGEREEPEHLNWSVFVSKPFKGQSSVFMPRASGGGDAAAPDANSRGAFSGGGLEISCTTIDHELILDCVAVHDSGEKLEAAWRAKLEGPAWQLKRDRSYRGPYVGELDEEFVDEILNYLDERGINNGFAEFLMSQWHVVEQQEYENWLRMLMVFSTPRTGDTKGSGTAAAASASASASSATNESEGKSSGGSSSSGSGGAEDISSAPQSAEEQLFGGPASGGAAKK